MSKTIRIKDVVHTRTWVNNEGKTMFHNTPIGGIIQTETGSWMLKLDFVPTDITNGFIMLFDIKARKAVAPVVQQTTEQAPF